MARIRVGVERLVDGFPAHETDHPERAVEVKQHWVQIGDALITADDGLVSVTYGPDEPGGFGFVTIRVMPSSFETVDVLDTPECDCGWRR